MKYIFEVCIKEGHSAEEYAEAWVRASELIQRAPGGRSTELRRKIGDPNTLIAIASWEQGAQGCNGGQHDSKIDEIIRSTAPFVEVRPIGEFEEPDWVVRPSVKTGLK